MTEVEKAELTVRNLENIRKHILVEQAELADERQRVSFAAHTGDKKSRTRLDEINIAAAKFASEFASIEAAIIEAGNRLEAAKVTEASAADRAQALLLKEAVAEFVEAGNELDASLEDMAFHANAMSDVLNRLHQLGAASPRTEQLRVLGAHCFKSALMKTPWKKELEFEHIPAHKLQSFKALVSTWADMLLRDAERRLGDQKDERAA